MAKKGGVPGLKEALAAVKASGKAGYKENKADYLVTLSASKAGQANYAAQVGAYSALNQRVNARAVGALQNLRGQARKSARAVRESEARAVGRYGSALGGSISSQFGQAEAVGRAGVMTAKAAVQQGKGTAAAAGLARGIAAEGVSAQAQAAKYALAQAFQARNMVTAETMAQLTGQLYQTALQYNMQWDLWKRQQDYAVKAAQKQQDKQLAAQAQSLATELPSIGADAAEAYGSAQGAKGLLQDPVATATAWAQSNGYSTSDPEYVVMLTILQKMQTGMTPQAATKAAMEKLYGSAGNFNSIMGILGSSVESGVHTELLARMPFDQAYNPAHDPNAEFWGLVNGGPTTSANGAIVIPGRPVLPTG